MKTHTLSLLCAWAFLSFLPLQASNMEKELLKRIAPHHRAEGSSYVNGLGDDMQQAILNAGFKPQERKVVIKYAQDITSQKLPLLKTALAPLVGESGYGA